MGGGVGVIRALRSGWTNAGRWGAAVVVVAMVAGCGGQQSPGGGGGTTVAPGPALQSTWSGYQRAFIQGDGRVIDHANQDISTSEGQSYAMLRAAWMHDRHTFDRVWRWTQDNLRVRGDALFAWKWGHSPSGSWTVLDRHSASDADEDIALALVFASRQWADRTYLEEAQVVLNGIWEEEVTRVGGSPVLVAGDWAAATPSGAVVDPSYLSPAEYRIFAGVAPAHPWSSLAAGSYRILRTCSAATLGAKSSAGLPPNWCALGASGPQQYHGLPAASAYGYDAFRVMWRVALDAVWFGSSDARSYLGSMDFLRKQWQQHGRLAAEYGRDGTPLHGGREDPTVYGGDVGLFAVTEQGAATSILDHKLLTSYGSQDGVALWGGRSNYYEQNWVWFGVALASGKLPNLAS
jgi:endoglucanase